VQETRASLLRQQESERILFDAVPAKIWYKDLHNRMLRVNRPAALASGHSVEALEGASTYDIFPEEAERFYQDDLEVIRSGEPRRGIIESITFNGEVRWLETDKIPIRGADGEVTGVMVFSVDVTERRRAEEEVTALTRALENRIAELQALLDVIPVGIGIADDPACERIRVNTAFAQLLGIPQDVNASLSAAGSPDLTFKVMSEGEAVPPDDLPIPRAAREGRRIDNVELDIVRADGSTIKLLASAAPVLDAEGVVRGAVGTSLDITMRHGAEQALRESEERFREMAENISEVLWMTDPWRSKVLYVSPRYEEIFGASTSTLYENPLSFFELVHPQDREKLLTAWRSGHEGDHDEEFRIIRSDGDVYWIRIRAFALRGPDGKVLRIVGIAGDITAWKQVEQGQRLLAAAGEILAASLDEDELLRGIGEVAVRAFADTAFFDSLDADGEIRRVAWKGGGDSADRFDRIRGFTPPRGAHTHPVARAFDAGEATLVTAVTDEWLERTAISEEHLQHLRSLDLASVITVPVIARERRIAAMTFIRQRARAEPFTTHDLELAQELARRTALAVDNARLFRESARALEQRAVTLSLLDTTLASAPIGLGFWDQELRFVRVNHALAALNGLPVDAHLGRTLREVLPSLAAELEPVVQRVFETGEAVIDLPVTGSSVAAPDDVRHWLESFYPVRDDAGHIRWVGVTVADITDRKRAQAALESLAQSLERLVAERTAALQTRAADLTRSNAELQQFAYVASHDLQEPLRMVANFAQLLAHRYHDRLGEDADEFIGYIVDGVGRMHALISGLLSYARLGREDLTLEPVDLHAACEQAVRQLSQAVSESGATITLDLLPTVSADPTQMVQLFQNLIGNALKFRGTERPRIQIRAEWGIPTPAGAETGPPAPASPHRRVTDPADSAGWIISVGDNGIGIAPEHAQRIFMIFQRLHQRDEYPGTGLGLAICKKIVENLGGQIWVEPNEGGGSVFRFSIPASKVIEGAGPPADEANATPIPERGATST
jgi:PAS domain S-box-containing protein